MSMEVEEDNNNMEPLTTHYRTIIFVDNYYAPFIMCIGTIGNFILLITFCASRIKSHWSSVYFVIISASSCLFNIMLTLSYVNTWHYLDIMSVNGWCQIESYLMRISEVLPVVFAFGYSVEVYVHARNPVQRVNVFTKSRKKRWVVTLLLLTCLVCSYTIFVTGIYEQTCLYLSSHVEFSQFLFSVETIAAIFLPGFLILILGVVTSIRLRRINRYCLNWRSVNAAKIHQAKKKSLESSQTAKTDSTDNALLPVKPRLCTVPEETAIDIRDYTVPTSSPEFSQGTLVFICVVICFLTVPYSVVRFIITWYGVGTEFVIFIALVLTHLLFYTQYWILFFLLFAFDRLFRKIICKNTCKRLCC